MFGNFVCKGNGYLRWTVVVAQKGDMCISCFGLSKREHKMVSVGLFESHGLIVIVNGPESLEGQWLLIPCEALESHT